MALKQVVAGRFFSRMTELLQQLDRDRGPLALALLDSQYRSGPTTWNLSISAKWLDRMDLISATKVVNLYVRSGLGDLASQYSFTQVRRTTDYMVRTLVPLFDIRELGTAYSVQALELELFNLDDVVVLLADSTQLTTVEDRIPA